MGFLDKKILELLKEVIRLDSDYYPAILRKFYLMNTPKVFAMVWGIVKNFFDKGTLEKFEISTDEKKIVKDLKIIVPPKYLPEYLGGECAWKMPDVTSLKETVKTLKKQQKKVKEREKSN